MTPSTTPEHLDYNEYSASAGINQLIGPSLSLGAQYTYTRSKLHAEFPEIPFSVTPSADRHEQADLQHATAFILWNHPSGFFSRLETHWYWQRNEGYNPGLEGEDIFMHNVLIGYRFVRQRAELSFGILNLADTDYRLNPLNPYVELPRERVFVGRIKVNF